MENVDVVVSHRMEAEKLSKLDEYIMRLRREMKLARPTRSSVMRGWIDERIEEIKGKSA